MNSKRISAAVLVAMLGVAGAASAQNRHDNDRNDRHDNDRDRYSQDRRNDRNDYRQDDDRGRDHDRGAGPRHNLHKGSRLPPEYRNRQYVVDNWRAHRLSAPPRGYHWVQTGGDYVLVAITTGIIASLLLSN
jgi:Ni/Co efflux regulator RcnB